MFIWLIQAGHIKFESNCHLQDSISAVHNATDFNAELAEHIG